MNNHNLQARIENARCIGQQYRFNYRTLQSNPFERYDGINGDGKLIQEAFIRGWKECDADLLKRPR